MDSINDESSMSVEDEEEDRISNLADDIIHRILGFLDMKYVVQTCTLAHRWKFIWTSIPNLNFNSDVFPDLSQFTYFVKHALARRNIHTEVSAVDITYTGKETASVVKSIVNYAYSRNARQLTLTSLDCIWSKFPSYLFISHTLKYLTFYNNPRFSSRRSRIPNPALVLPALETLYLGNIRFGDFIAKNPNVFSKCVNLKDLTLHECSMYNLDSFTIYAPQLVNLKVTGSFSFPKVFNVVAPQLKNLTASLVSHSGHLMSCFNYLRLSTEGFSSLDKVNLALSKGKCNKNKLLPLLLNLFHDVRSAKLLILDVGIIKCLSSSIRKLVQEPCPLNSLKCLKINIEYDPIPTKTTEVRNYLLENSPNATFIMDSPQVAHKRSRQQVPIDTMPMKVAKLDAGKSLPETMVEKIRMLEETLQIRDQLIANLKTELQMKDQVIANLKANIQMNDQVIADQNANIQMNDQVTANLNANIQIKDQVIANQKENIQMKDQVVANQNENIQLKDQVIAKQKAVIRRLKSNNIHMQSDVPAPPAVP